MLLFRGDRAGVLPLKPQNRVRGQVRASAFLVPRAWEMPQHHLGENWELKHTQQSWAASSERRVTIRVWPEPSARALCVAAGSGAQPSGAGTKLRAAAPELPGRSGAGLGLGWWKPRVPSQLIHSLGNKSRGRMEWERAASKVPARGKDKTKSVFKLHACLNFALLLCHYFEKPKLCS